VTTPFKAVLSDPYDQLLETVAVTKDPATGSTTVVVVKYTLGGTVRGLAGSALVLANNGQTVTINGSPDVVCSPSPGCNSNSFVFPSPLSTGTAYNVTVKTQPAGQTCTVSSGSGSVAAAVVSNVVVNCVSNAYTLGGGVSGLAASGLVLASNGQTVSVAANASSFGFASKIAAGSSYNVTVQTQPSGKTCTVRNGSGIMPAANVTNVVVNCTNAAYTLGGTVSGNTSALVLNADGQTVTVPACATTSCVSNFAFGTGLVAGLAYNVIVQTQPAGQTCTVSNGYGVMAASNVDIVTVTCTTQSYTLGGSISGLSGSGLMLAATGQSVSPAAGSASFAFANKLALGTVYNVTVQSQPSGQTCTVSSGSGSIPAADVVSVQVNCTDTTYTLGGTITTTATLSGLVLRNGSQTLTLPTIYCIGFCPTVNFQFTNKLPAGIGYSVSVQTQPSGLTCSVSNGSGIMPAANVSSVAVNCVSNSYTLGGSISGLTASGLMLVSGSQTITVAANASSFSFPTAIAAGTSYSVTVQTQPTGQTCTVSNGSGTMPTGNVSNVVVNCVNSDVGALDAYCGYGQWVIRSGSTEGYCPSYGSNVQTRVLEEINSRTDCGGFYKTLGMYSDNTLIALHISNGNCRAAQQDFPYAPPEAIAAHCQKYGGTGAYRWAYSPTVQPFGGYGTLGVACAMPTTGGGGLAKPVIYLYPEKQQRVEVRLEYQGELIADYPKYQEGIKGWNVTAYPDGRLIDNFDQHEYSYIFWEGMPRKPVDWDFSHGFIVKGENAQEFLREKLTLLGLLPKEYNEFIVYWYPLMKKNKYNLVHFSGEQYSQMAPLSITPKPDSIQRVFMVLKSVDTNIMIPEQELKPFSRTGFSVIEWGGTEIK